MTEKLYYQDQKMQNFTARVLSCEFDEKKACYGIVLDRTAFFPEGGGQYADPGVLNGIAVQDVKEKGEVIIHYLKEAIEVGSEVSGQIDFDVRFSRMQQHSGEHIVSGIVHKHFGYENVGFHLGDEITTLDFNGPLTEEQVRQVEWEANEAVFRNVPIQVSYPTKEERDLLEYRSKKELSGQVRIVTIPGYDVCACCAPHVTLTGEIGLIKLVDVVKYKGGVRVTMMSGFRALQDYQEKENSVREISRALSAKPNEVAGAVSRLRNEVGKCKETISRLQSGYLEDKLDEITDETVSYVLFEEEMDKNAGRRFVDAGMRKVSGICGLFLGNDEKGYSYTMGSMNVNMRDFLKEFHEVCPGKGGGKPEMVQGSVSASRDVIEGFLFSVEAGEI